MSQYPSILCPQCHRRSYHPADIVQRYCGHCHQFHDYMPLAYTSVEAPKALKGPNTDA